MSWVWLRAGLPGLRKWVIPIVIGAAISAISVAVISYTNMQGELASEQRLRLIAESQRDAAQSRVDVLTHSIRDLIDAQALTDDDLCAALSGGMC